MLATLQFPAHAGGLEAQHICWRLATFQPVCSRTTCILSFSCKQASKTKISPSSTCARLSVPWRCIDHVTGCRVVSRGVMLACFTGEAAATQALAKFRHRAIKLRLVSSATVAGVSSLPRPIKPKRDVTVARRLIGRALGVRTTAPSTRSSRETAGQLQRSAPAAATPPARKVRGRGATRRGGASGSRTRGWDDDSW